MIPPSKLKKIVISSLLKHIDCSNDDIWDACSKDIYALTESQLITFDIKIIFFKYILSDLVYNNFGYDDEIIEKLRNFGCQYAAQFRQEELEKNCENSKEESIATEINLTTIVPEIGEEVIIDGPTQAEFVSQVNDSDIDRIMQKYGFVECDSEDSANSAVDIIETTKRIICEKLGESNTSQRNENSLNSNIISNEDQQDEYDLLCEGRRISDIVMKFPHASKTFSKSVLTRNMGNVQSARASSSNRKRKKITRRPSEIDHSGTRNPSIGRFDEDIIGIDMVINELQNEEKSNEGIKQSSIDEHKIHKNCQKPHEPGPAHDSSIVSDNKNNSNTLISTSHNAPSQTNNTPMSDTEIAEKLQKQIDSLTDIDEINKILKENFKYRHLLSAPVFIPGFTVADTGSDEEDDEMQGNDYITNVQKQLDSLKDPQEIERILQKNEKYRHLLRVPVPIPGFTIADPDSEDEEDEMQLKSCILNLQKQLNSLTDAEQIEELLRQNEKYRHLLSVPVLIPGFTIADTDSDSDEEQKICATKEKSKMQLNHKPEINKITDKVQVEKIPTLTKKDSYLEKKHEAFLKIASELTKGLKKPRTRKSENQFLTDHKELLSKMQIILNDQTDPTKMKELIERMGFIASYLKIPTLDLSSPSVFCVDEAEDNSVSNHITADDLNRNNSRKELSMLLNYI